MDTLISGVFTQSDLNKMKWETAVENILLIPVKKAARKFGFTCNVALTKRLFEEIYPYAEDANKDVYFMDRMEDLAAGLKRGMWFATGEHLEFDISVPTVISEVIDHDTVRTRRRKADKKLTVFATSMPDGHNKPAVVFGLKEVR